MKDLIIQAMDAAFVKASKQIPKTKRAEKDIVITDVKPIDLPVFMRANGVPDDAKFGSRNNGYDWYDEYDGNILLYWFVDVPYTKEDSEKFMDKRFPTVAFKMIYDTLTSNGYKRVGVNSSEFSKFRDFNKYEMYRNKQFDRLVEYYSLYFKKIIDNVG